MASESHGLIVPLNSEITIVPTQAANTSSEERAHPPREVLAEREAERSGAHDRGRRPAKACVSALSWTEAK
jgi:hypothetical protein